ncbi:PP2C family serine/threonine-protein phosphatase [Gemmatimonas sp.]|uniref:PP2C family protein-serine/threonine phosphatase n=1 Tax=Gemmatimonas sp. TaxID=1962908 RepID=UPI003341B712
MARVFALTDVGQSREHNEDTFLVANLESGATLSFEEGVHEVTADAHGLLFLVADGMGGAASGELASSMAGQLVLEGLRDSWSKATTPDVAAFAEALRDATVLANTRIHQHARENPEHRGMGTTATIAGLLGDRLFLVQVGDSRAYMVRDGLARQITKDQSLMQRLVEAGELTPEEAEVSDRRNIILQALGPEAQITVDLTHQQLRRGDTLILCSDGLSGLVRGEEIGALTTTEPDVRLVCRKLVDRANARGGPDNITVIAVRFEGDALVASTATDSVGYTAYPLEGTLYDQTREMPTSRPPRNTIKSDPTPRQGVRMPTRSEQREADAAQRNIDDKATVAAPLPEPAIAERKRAVQPLFILLGSVALAALVWTVVQLLRR